VKLGEHRDTRADDRAHDFRIAQSLHHFGTAFFGEPTGGAYPWRPCPGAPDLEGYRS
jgi:hypothetical protein